MKTFAVSMLLFISVLTISAQSHDKALKDFAELKQKADKFKVDLEKKSAKLEQILLQPDKEDLAAAEREKVDVFRLLPRETYDKDIFKVRGGGAFYSFSNKSHSYNEIPQISLEQNKLSVGFYGASYGLIADLQKTPLSQINPETENVNYLVNYKPPAEEKEARNEYRKIQAKYERNGLVFTKTIPVIVGDTYILRAVSYNEADTLVSFKIHRQDSDGSLIIFWKLLKTYEIPKLNRTVSAK